MEINCIRKRAREISGRLPWGWSEQAARPGAFACSPCIKFISRVPGTIELNKQRFSITFRALLSSLFMSRTHTCVAAVHALLEAASTPQTNTAANCNRNRSQPLSANAGHSHTHARATHFQYFRFPSSERAQIITLGDSSYLGCTHFIMASIHAIYFRRFHLERRKLPRVGHKASLRNTLARTRAHTPVHSGGEAKAILVSRFIRCKWMFESIHSVRPWTKIECE